MFSIDFSSNFILVRHNSIWLIFSPINLSFLFRSVKKTCPLRRHMRLFSYPPLLASVNCCTSGRHVSRELTSNACFMKFCDWGYLRSGFRLKMGAESKLFCLLDHSAPNPAMLEVVYCGIGFGTGSQVVLGG